MISRLILVDVSDILTSTLIIPDNIKTSSNNCLKSVTNNNSSSMQITLYANTKSINQSINQSDYWVPNVMWNLYLTQVKQRGVQSNINMSITKL